MSEAETGVLDFDKAMDETLAGMEGLNNEPADIAAPEPVPNPEPVDEIPMPQSWKKEWEPDWKATPKTARERFIERERQMLEGLNGYKENAKYGESLRKAFEPYMDILRAQGLDEAKTIAYLLNAHKGLSDKASARQWLDRIAASYGIEMQPQGAQQQDGRIPFEANAALEKINRLEWRLNQRDEAEMAARHQVMTQQVEAFAKDPAHPYFDECSDNIVRLIQAGYSLEDAYSNAVWMNPVTRQKEIGRLQKEQAEEARKKAAEAAQQARKAKGINVKGRDSARTPTEPAATVADMESSMKETLAEIRSRT